LIDTQLLAEVYLAMTRGQDSLLREEAESGKTPLGNDLSAPQSNVLVLQASSEELERHTKYLEALEQKENVKPAWLSQSD
jgi:DNA polymerase-3 subunit epsilon